MICCSQFPLRKESADTVESRPSRPMQRRSAPSRQPTCQVHASCAKREIRSALTPRTNLRCGIDAANHTRCSNSETMKSRGVDLAIVQRKYWGLSERPKAAFHHSIRRCGAASSSQTLRETKATSVLYRHRHPANSGHMLQHRCFRSASPDRPLIRNAALGFGCFNIAAPFTSRVCEFRSGDFLATMAVAGIQATATERALPPSFLVLCNYLRWPSPSEVGVDNREGMVKGTIGKIGRIRHRLDRKSRVFLGRT